MNSVRGTTTYSLQTALGKYVVSESTGGNWTSMQITLLDFDTEGKLLD